MFFGILFRDKFNLVLGNLKVGSFISSREYDKSGRTRLFSKFNFVCLFLSSDCERRVRILIYIKAFLFWDDENKSGILW